MPSAEEKKNGLRNLSNCNNKVDFILSHCGPQQAVSELSYGSFKPDALRAQDEIRAVAIEMKKQVKGVLPEFSKKLQPHCKYLMWCPEGKNDCMAPTKDELRKIIGKAD